MSGGEPSLRLFSDGLLSKYGFNDGDAPDEFFDYCDERGVDYPSDWHRALIALVRRYLLPALDQDVTVVQIGCNHNPIRAETIDGLGVRDLWRLESAVALTPEYVEVPMSEVLRIAEESQDYCPDHKRDDAAGEVAR